MMNEANAIRLTWKRKTYWAVPKAMTALGVPAYDVYTESGSYLMTEFAQWVNAHRAIPDVAS